MQMFRKSDIWSLYTGGTYAPHFTVDVMALIAIMEPATESQSSRAYKQPLRSCPSNKIKVLLDSGSDGDLYFLPKGKDKRFP